MLRPLRSTLLTVMAVLAAACATAPRAAQEPGVKASEDDTLRPGDIVRLRIWRENDLSGDYQIDYDGVVVLPKLGPLVATEEPPAQLEQRIVEMYGRYLRNPSIEVFFLRRVNVQGAVMRPGLYPLDPTMTVGDALALAGGPTPTGKPSEVQLLRGGERVTIAFDQSTRIGDLPIRSGDQLYVPERSWFVRNQGLVSAFLGAATTIMITVFTYVVNRNN